MVYAHHVDVIRAKTEPFRKKLEAKNCKIGHLQIGNINDLIESDLD